MEIYVVRTEDGDWEGVYFGDELYDEGHTVELTEVLEGIAQGGFTITSVETYEVTEESIEELGYSFPANFSELEGHLH